MRYYWVVKDGYSYVHGPHETVRAEGGIEITEEKDDEITAAEALRPAYREGYGTRLRADTLEWEEFELPKPERQETLNDVILDMLAEQEERICNLELFGE